jgi:hypothetical protein
MDDGSRSVAFMAGAFAASLLIAFLISRLGLYLRRSSRFEPGTVVGVHILSFFLLGAVACSSRASTPGSSALVAFVAQAIILLIDLLRLPRPEDYSDDVPQSLRPLEGARLVAVIASILLGFGLVYGLGRPTTDREMIAELERSLVEVPGAGPYLASLKRNFPNEYQSMVTDTVRRLRENRAQGKSGPAMEGQLGEELGHRILAMIASKSAAVPKAPTPALNAYSRAMKDYAVRLEKPAPQACAALAMGPSPGPAPVLPPATQEASGLMLAARLDLVRAALDHPTERDLSKPPLKALQELNAAMKRRNASLGAALDEPGGVLMLTTRERCSLAILYYSAMADLPPETSALIAAYDLSPAASPGSDEASAPPPGR